MTANAFAPSAASIGTAARLAAIGTGTLVATLYLTQPLIEVIRIDLDMSRSEAGIVVTIFQIAYALGLILIVPLADRYENRLLVAISFAVTAASLAALSQARELWTFLLPAALAGFSCVGAQILVPMVAGMAPPEIRGRTIGIVMSGLLIGIVLARPLSGFAASLVGWRDTFLIAACMALVVGAVLTARLPRRQPGIRFSYLANLRSLAPIVRKHPLLRRRMVSQAALFAMFSAYWTTVPFLLKDIFSFGEREIGFFALAAAGGAFVAPMVGRAADRGLTRMLSAAAIGGCLFGLLATLPFLWLASWVGLLVAALVLDACVQANHIVGQRLLYGLSDTERARINAIYMTAMFVAAAIASAAGPVLYELFSWPAIVLLGAALSLISLAAAFYPERTGAPETR